MIARGPGAVAALGPLAAAQNNFTLSGGGDVAQALVPAGSRLFSTLWKSLEAPR